MKHRHGLFVFPLLLLSLFSCKKSDISTEANAAIPVKTIKPPNTKATTYDPEHPVNVRVRLSNLDHQPVFAHIMIIPGGVYSALPVDEKVINIHEVEVEPVTEVFFSVLPGMYYTVLVKDTYGQAYYSPNLTASYGEDYINFQGQIAAPAILKYVGTPIPLPPDDGPSNPPTPGTTSSIMIRVPANIEGSPVAQCQLVGEDFYTALQTRSLKVEGSSEYLTIAIFDVANGTKFHATARSESGALMYSKTLTAGEDFFYTF